MAVAVAPAQPPAVQPWRCWKCREFLGHVPACPPGTLAYLYCSRCGKKTRLDRRPAPG
jgi:hypothetical protein